ncbi:hypothetical protein FH972_002645 [Carpinus fangiana]|uniref:Uncharacterized protein n=1 Tax=Carpinus fangiana TaxID=176857 RepID=A0A5N6QFV0_9ROSI|nr:hypothetical protein FH972_002645 [Carpinus fangiana]
MVCGSSTPRRVGTVASSSSPLLQKSPLPLLPLSFLPTTLALARALARYKSSQLINPSLLDQTHRKLSNPIMEMEVVVPVPPPPLVDFNFNSNCSSPYMTAPSSPQRFGSFIFSAPTSLPAPLPSTSSSTNSLSTT